MTLGTGLTILTCALGGGDDETPDAGGSGADFDATQYYTKTEVDTQIEAARQIVVSDAEMKTITGIGYANGAGPFPRPAGAKGAVVWFQIENLSGIDDGIEINFSSDTPDGNGSYWRFLTRVPINSTIRVPAVIRLNGTGTEDKAWMVEAPPAGLTIKAAPLFYFQ